MCPHCGADNSKVLETRRTHDTVYRRRRCRDDECGKTFISEETSSLKTRFPVAMRQAMNARLRAINPPSETRY